jgi:hypothetical protein
MEESTEIQLLKEFKQQITLFFDQLIDLLPNSSELILGRIFVTDQSNIEDVMKIFVLKFLPLKEYIISRDFAFFLENNSIFENIDNNKVKKFKKIWRTIDNEDRNAIWNWIILFINFAERYQRINISN